jgi:hypothetical protein
MKLISEIDNKEKNLTEHSNKMKTLQNKIENEIKNGIKNEIEK